MKRLSALLYLICLACPFWLIACSRPLQQAQNVQVKPMQIIWSGTSADYRIAWTTKDISASSNVFERSRPVAFSDTGLTVLEFSDIGNHQTTNCDFRREASVLSIVGRWLSLQHSDDMRCGDASQPAHSLEALAIDLAQPQRRPLLTDIFSQHAVLLGLLRATPLHNTLLALHASPPQTAAAFVNMLAASRVVCGANFPKNFLNRFAFQQVRGNQVLVRLGLPLSCKASEVTLWLPASSSQARAFARAASRKEGFLLAGQAAIANGRSTTILYHLRMSGETP